MGQHGGSVNIDKMGLELVLLRDGDHGFNGDGAVDDGRGLGQSERLQQGMKGAAGGEANDGSYKKRGGIGFVYCPIGLDWGANRPQVGVADV